ncbi:MAG TPA: hypothetical protein VEC37_14825 [Bacillota bacterium]|nr:hypothetical protein [Bacillota bacterium]
MSQIWQLTVAEIKLTLRSKIFWFLSALVVLFSFLSSFLLLFQQLMVVIALKRDRRVGLAEMLNAVPYDPVKLYLARALAMLCLLAVLFPFIILTATQWSGIGAAEWLNNGKQILSLFIKYLTTAAFSIGVVFLAGTVSRRPGRVDLIIWLGWILGLIFGSSLTSFPAWAALFSLGHGVMLFYAPSAVMGYGPQQELLLAFVGFQSALALLFILGAAARSMHQRGESFHSSRLGFSLAVAGVVLGIIAGVTACWKLERREVAMSGTFANATLPIVLQKQVTPTLEAYQLDLQLQTAAQHLTAKAIIKLKLPRPGSGLIAFTLRPYFTVRQVVLEGQNFPLQWRRNGPHLLVEIPEKYRNQQSPAVRIDYAGRVWEWFPGRLQRPIGPVNYISDSFALLRSGYAWYPVPGTAVLYSEEKYLNPWNRTSQTIRWGKPVNHAAVPFELSVQIDNDNTVVSNLKPVEVEALSGKYRKKYRFCSLQGRNVYLIAGPYLHQTKNFPKTPTGIEVYCFRKHSREVNRMVRGLVKPYRFYADWCASSGEVNLVEIPAFFFHTEDGCGIKELTLTDTVLINENYFREDRGGLPIVTQLRNNKHDLDVLQRWWQEDFTRDRWNQNGSIVEGITLYLYIRCAETTRGLRILEKVKQNLVDGKTTNFEDFNLPFVTGGPVVREVFLILEGLRNDDLGDSAVKRVVRQLYQVYRQHHTVSSREFAAAVTAVMEDTPLPPEQAIKIRDSLNRIIREVRNPKNRQITTRFNLTIFPFNLTEWLP